MINITIKKHGKTKYNVCWAYATIFDTEGLLCYTGIVQLKEDYAIVDGSTYSISSVDLGFNKKNVLQVIVALK